MSPAAAQPRLIHTGTQLTGGNGDDWIEPGETLALKLALFNGGNATAVSVGGTLTYLGSHPGVTVTGPVAAWPNIPAQSAPVLTSAPFFELQVGSQVPCGTVMPFRLEVDIAGSHAASFPMELKAGQRIDHDMLHDPPRRFEEQEATFWGAVGSDWLGYATAHGDIDGDGYDDLVVSAPAVDANSGTQVGAVYLIYGRPQQWIDRDLALATPLISRFQGADTGDFLGFPAGSLATGDINGDGFDDIIIGAEQADSVGNQRATAGEAYVIYGKATQWANTDLAIPPAGVVRFWGADSLDFLGHAVATGDLNGDGFDDVILGAYSASSLANARPVAGEAYVIYGKAAPWADADLASPPAGISRIWGAQDTDELGSAMAVLNLNGDGLDDLALGAGLAAPGGAVFIIHGQPTQIQDIDLASPPSGVARLLGAETHDSFGGSVFSGVIVGGGTIASGDVDNDGLDDLIVAAVLGDGPGNTNPGSGEVYLIHGAPGTWSDMDMASPPPGSVARFWAALPGENVGSSLGTGDLNGDGYADIIIAARGGDQNAPCDPGRTYVVYGRRSRWSDTQLELLPSVISRYQGADACDHMGFAVTAGDFNRDGYDDLVLGVPFGDGIGNSRVNSGEAYLWYGKPTDTYLAAPATSSPYIHTTQIPGAKKLALSCDNCSLQVPIGFRFPFYAEEFNTLFVSSNGYLSFSPPTPGSTLPETCMPSRTGANHLIAPYWDDLNPGASTTGGVFSLLQGTAPYRRLTIEWKDVPHATSVGVVSFEVTLYETSGQIHFRYKDVLFGVPALDNGASAVVGLENRTGAHGVAFSCNVSTILDSTRVVRFVPTTPVFEEHGELTGPLWGPTGHWHNSTNTCEPDQHSGSRGWYYGNAASCAYSNGFAGALRAPTVEDFPADARLAYWSRLGTQPGVDLPEVQLSTTGTGGPYATFQSPGDNSMIWRYAGYTNLFFNAGDTVDLQYNFSSNASVSSLGWMVDDIQLVGCDATGAAQVVLAAAYAPPQICVGASAIADAFGSYCGESHDPARFQWYEDGAPISGAEEETFRIADTPRPGAHDYSVEITCESGARALSEPAPVMIAQPPDPVAPTLEVEVLEARPEPILFFRWDESPGADEYVVLQDVVPSGAFLGELGTSPAGDPTLRVPIPPGDILYFLVAGRNLGCGLGPIR